MSKEVFDALVAYVEASELRAAYRAQSTMKIDGPAWDRINGVLLEKRTALFKLMVHPADSLALKVESASVAAEDDDCDIA